jgi:hypothetical protein
MSKYVRVNIHPEVSAPWGMAEFSRSLHIEKNRGRSRIQCAMNCRCWRYRYSPCQDNSSWIVTTHFASSESKPLLLTIIQTWCFAIGFSQNALWTHSLQLTFCLLMRWDSREPILWAFIILMPEWMAVSTSPRHQNINIDFSSVSEWAC